jgi:acyl-CoA thioesterase I
MSPTKKKAIIALLLILVASVLVVAIHVGVFLNQNAPADLSRVALVGDSLTEFTSYPVDLQTLLGENSSVGNFGASGTTVLLSSVNPYLFQNVSSKAKDFQPTVVIIMLGTNDARPDAFNHIDDFKQDYKQLINKFQSQPSQLHIFLVIPPPFFENDFNLSRTNFESGVIPRIEQVAQETGLPLIDVYTPLLDHREYFVDGVHLNEAGSQAVADVVYKQITENNIRT